MPESLEPIGDSLAVDMMIDNGTGKRVSYARPASLDFVQRVMAEVRVGDRFTGFKPVSVKIIARYYSYFSPLR
ncbi:MAG: hypothetical protein ACREX4_13340 [Gammaproteobacteria bacterium]